MTLECYAILCYSILLYSTLLYSTLLYSTLLYSTTYIDHNCCTVTLVVGFDARFIIIKLFLSIHCEQLASRPWRNLPSSKA
jgi:hypothetical protein